MSLAVVGPDGEAAVAVLLLSGLAGGALATGVDQAADGGGVAYFEFGDGGAYGGYFADDLVAGDHGVHGVAPLVAGLVDVGVADAAELDVDEDVVGAGVAVLVVEGDGRGGGRVGGVAVRCNHLRVSDDFVGVERALRDDYTHLMRAG